MRYSFGALLILFRNICPDWFLIPSKSELLAMLLLCRELVTAN
jgi:hypothetical protein